MHLAINAERARQPTRSGPQQRVFHARPPLFHDFQPGNRFDRANQHETRALSALHQDIEKPMHPIVHVNVGISLRLPFHKRPRARSKPRVTRRIILRIIRLRLHNPPDAALPHKLATYQPARTSHRILREKVLPDRPHPGIFPCLRQTTSPQFFVTETPAKP